MSEEVCGRCIYLEEFTQQQYSDLHSMLQEFNPIELPGNQDDELLVAKADTSECIPMRVPVEPTSREEAEYSKSAILALNQKLKLMKFMQDEIDQLQELLGESKKNAGDLQDSADETFAQLQKHIQEHEQACKETSADISNLKNLIAEEEEKISQMENTIFGSDEHVLELENAAEKLREETKDVEEVKKEVELSQKGLTDIEASRFQLYEEVLSTSKSFLGESEDLSVSAKGLEHDNANLRNKISELKEELEQERKNQYEVMRMRQQKKTMLTKLNTLNVLANDEKEFALHYKGIGERYDQMIQTLENDLQDSFNKYKELTNMLVEQDNQIKDSIQALQEHINRVLNKISIQENVIDDMTGENKQLENRNKAYQDVLDKPVHYSVDSESEAFIEQASKKLLVMSDLFLLQAYRIKMANRSANHLKELVSKFESDIISSEIEAVNTQATHKVYCAKTDDPLDRAVEKILSELPAPLQEGFVRVPKGYMYGNKLLELELEGSAVYGNFYVVKEAGRKTPLQAFLS